MGKTATCEHGHVVELVGDENTTGQVFIDTCDGCGEAVALTVQ